MRIVCLPSNYDAAGHYRVLMPAWEMVPRGHKVGKAPGLTEFMRDGSMTYYGVYGNGPDGRPRLLQDIVAWLLAAEFDVLVMNQRDEPWTALIEALQAQGKRVFIDSDDDWLRLPHGNPGRRRSPEDRRNMLDMLAAADGMTVSTPALQGLYSPYQENVKVIRNRLHWGMWADAPLAYERETRRVRVGWMGGSRWHRHDLAILRGVIGPWLELHPEVEFVAAGDPLVHDMLGVPHAQRVSVMPTHFHKLDLADITAVMDIGLVPLTGGVFNDCKSHLKGLEYAACGIPCIATPTESYRWWVEPGINGLLARADRPRHWREALDQMLEGWRDMGANARQKAERNVIQGAGADEWEHAWNIGVGDHADTPRQETVAA